MILNEAETKDFIQRYYTTSADVRFEQMLQECKHSVIQSIVVPFGIGNIIAAYDKVGGNVDTIHNARLGIYATGKERQRFETREKYNSDDYHKDQNYIDINRQLGKQIESGNVSDYLTGNKILKRDSVDLDHIVSTSEIHNDPGKILAEIDGRVLANTESNLAFTDKSLNRSKQDQAMIDFLRKRDERLSSIKKLEEKRDLTQSEIRELEKLKKQLEIDDKEALRRDKEARDSINKAIDREYYSSNKFMQKAATTSVMEGSKMGFQQAVGLIVVEFFTALFDEIRDIYQKGFFVEEDFFDSLSIRVKNIIHKLKSYIATKYKEIVATFKDGFLSGILSNLATTMINIFMTTSKRLIRIIREGIFSFFRAIKLVLFPPSNLSRQEAWHEAKKLIVSGLIVGVGVFVEQAVQSFLMSLGLGGFTETFTSIFVGALTGVAIAMAMYWLDTQKSIAQMRYEAISKLVLENLPPLIQERKELEIIIEATRKERLCHLQDFFIGYKEALVKKDDVEVYNHLNQINQKISGKELEVKDINDIKKILENPNRTGKLQW